MFHCVLNVSTSEFQQGGKGFEMSTSNDEIKWQPGEVKYIEPTLIDPLWLEFIEYYEEEKKRIHESMILPLNLLKGEES